MPRGNTVAAGVQRDGHRFVPAGDKRGGSLIAVALVTYQCPAAVPVSSGDAGLEFPGDQRIDDGGSLVYESSALDEELVLLGVPSLQLVLSSDAPVANIAVRIIDAYPDGTEARVSFGLLNLAHRMQHGVIWSETDAKIAGDSRLLESFAHHLDIAAA